MLPDVLPTIFLSLELSDVKALEYTGAILDSDVSPSPSSLLEGIHSESYVVDTVLFAACFLVALVMRFLISLGTFANKVEFR